MQGSAVPTVVFFQAVPPSPHHWPSWLSEGPELKSQVCLAPSRASWLGAPAAPAGLGSRLLSLGLKLHWWKNVELFP